MEALVIILVEFLLALAAPVIGACAALAMAIIDLAALVLSAVIALAARSLRGADAAPRGPAAPVRRRRARRRHLILLAPLGLVGLAGLTVNVLLFEPAARWAVGQVSARTGFSVGFAAAEGNIFTGRVLLSDVTVARPGGTRAGFDLRLARAEIDVELWSFVLRPVSLDALTLDTVTGEITKPVQPPEGGGELKPRKRFLIDRLEIRDARLWITGADGTDAQLEVVHSVSEPFRADYAVFDFFFRSNVEARIDGHPVTLATEPVDWGRHTSWDIENFPVASIAGLVPRAPFRWLEGGTVSARMRDDWKLPDTETPARIDMDWHVALSGVTVNVPADAGMVEKLSAGALAKVVNGREDDAVFDFTVVLDESQFRNSASLDAAGLWRALIASLAQTIADRRGGDAAETEGRLKSATSKLKSYFQREGQQPTE